MMDNGWHEIVDSFPLLSIDEAKALAVKAKAGDKEARQTLIVSNLRLVPATLKSYWTITDPDLYEEMFAVGNLALVKAVDRYDPEKGNPAGFFKKNIWSAVSDEWRKRLKLKPLESLDKKVTTEGFDRHMVTPSPDAGPEELVHDRLDRDELIARGLEHAKELNEFETIFLRLIHGLDNDRPMSVADIARLAKISPATVIAVHQNAFARLRGEEIPNKKIDRWPRLPAHKKRILVRLNRFCLSRGGQNSHALVQ